MNAPSPPRIVLCIPGPWGDRDEASARFREQGLDLGESALRDGSESFDAEYRGFDYRMRSAFQSSACRLRPSLRTLDIRAIEAHRGVVYVLGADAARLLDLGARVLDAGGLGVKSESSAIAHSAERWRELNARVRAGDAAALFDAYVRLPILSETQTLYSTGMHLLGLPDGLVELGDFPGEKGIPAATALLEGFLRSGQAPGFQATPEACTEYQEGELFWNPWGVLRLRRTPVQRSDSTE